MDQSVGLLMESLLARPHRVSYKVSEYHCHKTRRLPAYRPTDSYGGFHWYMRHRRHRTLLATVLPVWQVSVSELAPIHHLLPHLQLASPKALSLGRYFFLFTPHLFPPSLSLTMSVNSNTLMTRNPFWPCLLPTTVTVSMYFNLA